MFSTVYKDISMPRPFVPSSVSMLILLGKLLLSSILIGVFIVLYHFVKPKFSRLHELQGPPSNGLFHSHLDLVLDARKSPLEVEKLVKKYGRSFRVNGLGMCDERLITVDPVAINHILLKSWVYQKPWQSRRQLSRLMGGGLLCSEGSTHRLQRKVVSPAFAPKNLRSFLPTFFRKTDELCNRWTSLLKQDSESVEVDVSQWLGVLMLDILGLTSFDYSFNAIGGERDQIYLAVRRLLEIAFVNDHKWDSIIGIYFPLFNRIWRSRRNRIIDRSLRVLHQMGQELINKKRNALSKRDIPVKKDLLTLLLMSNLSPEVPNDQRLSDEDIFDQVLTFLLVGSDTTSLAIAWTLVMISKHKSYQDELRKELQTCSAASTNRDADATTDDAYYADLFRQIDALPYLNNIVRESLRLVPPVHSSIREAVRDDIIPLSEPISTANGIKKTSIGISKGQWVHIPIESFNLDRAVWGEDAWDFIPDRWTRLPDKAQQQPGVYPSLLSFSLGPRSCIGMTYSIMQMKVVLYVLLTNFEFDKLEDIERINLVFVRPFVARRTKGGSCCPLNIRLL